MIVPLIIESSNHSSVVISTHCNFPCTFFILPPYAIGKGEGSFSSCERTYPASVVPTTCYDPIGRAGAQTLARENGFPKVQKSYSLSWSRRQQEPHKILFCRSKVLRRIGCPALETSDVRTSAVGLNLPSLIGT